PQVLLINFPSTVVVNLLSSLFNLLQLSLPIHTLTALWSQPINGLPCLPTGQKLKWKQLSN
ncbi:MAG: hypothetical protein ACRCZW_00955, partial [Lactobacillaceae bacterium]